MCRTLELLNLVIQFTTIVETVQYPQMKPRKLQNGPVSGTKHRYYGPQILYVYTISWILALTFWEFSFIYSSNISDQPSRLRNRSVQPITHEKVAFCEDFYWLAVPVATPYIICEQVTGWHLYSHPCWWGKLENIIWGVLGMRRKCIIRISI